MSEPIDSNLLRTNLSVVRHKMKEFKISDSKLLEEVKELYKDLFQETVKEKNRNGEEGVVTKEKEIEQEVFSEGSLKFMKAWMMKMMKKTQIDNCTILNGIMVFSRRHKKQYE